MSRSVRIGSSMGTPGRFTPLNDDTIPEDSTMASTLEELAAVTVSRTVPSAMKMLLPGLKCLNTAGWGNGSTPGS